MKSFRFFVFFIFFSSIPCGLSFSSVTGKHGMVVSASKIASEVGLSILKKGGNAIDAAVAVGFTLAVVYPEAGNIGGGGFMLIRSLKSDEICIDFREVAPKAARKDMYIDSAGKVTDNIIRGPSSAAVPGTVAGLIDALEKYGSMKLKDVINPAIKLAKNGFVVDDLLEKKILEYENDLRLYPSTVKTFFKDGKRYTFGDTIRQYDLAKTLERIRDYGKNGFYKGTTAHLIVNAMKSGEGFITEKDLSDYKPVIRKPLKSTYRGYEIISCPLPSSGGICLIQMLKMLEYFNYTSFGYHSSKSVQLITEIMKRVYSDRAEYLGDPLFMNIPDSILISKAYAFQRCNEIDTLHATASRDIHFGKVKLKEHNNTTHYSIIDSTGNCVSVTYTINDLFGSQYIVDGAGFFLNNEMDDFSAKPGTQNLYGLVGGAANSIEAGKRPLSSMSPTIVTKNGKPVMILGARGGSAIITAMFQTITNVIDFGMNLENAITSPRFHHQWIPDTLFYEKYCLPKDVHQNLLLMGEIPSETNNYYGSVQAIYIDVDGSMLYGFSDPREGGTPLGY